MDQAERQGTPEGAVDPHEEAVLSEVKAALRAIRFGSVLIKIHDGEVVGIETSTKLRLKNGSKPA
jgi:hypothetical protein